MKKIRTTPSLRKKSKSRKKINRISTSKKPTKKRTSRKKRSKRQKGGMHPDDIHSQILRRYIGQKRRNEGQGEIPPIVLDHDIRPPPFNPSAPTPPSARSFAVQTDSVAKIKKTKQSNFFDKPKEIEYGIDKQFNIEIPRPPKGLLDEKEYIVFHKFLNDHGRPVSFSISSFGRFLQTDPSIPDKWLDMSSPDVAKAYQMDIPSLCFINQGWVQLLEFLDNNLRLSLTFHSVGGMDMSSMTVSSFTEVIPKILALYVQFFPDAVITETNNDPDVFFNK